MHALLQLDQSIFLWLNSLHTPWLDVAMEIITEKRTWIPLYVLIIAGLLWKFRLKGLLMIVLIVSAISLADYWASGICKPLFGRLRPCHEPDMQALIHLLPAGCGKKFGFMSSHATTAFAMATSLWLLLRTQYRWVGLFFVWAALIAYSRIYSGVHYLGDVVAGGASGALIAWALYRLYRYLNEKASRGKALIP